MTSYNTRHSEAKPKCYVPYYYSSWTPAPETFHFPFCGFPLLLWVNAIPAKCWRTWRFGSFRSQRWIMNCRRNGDNILNHSKVTLLKKTGLSSLFNCIQMILKKTRSVLVCLLVIFFVTRWQRVWHGHRQKNRTKNYNEMGNIQIGHGLMETTVHVTLRQRQKSNKAQQGLLFVYLRTDV